jgi:hypothetical protein
MHCSVEECRSGTGFGAGRRRHAAFSEIEDALGKEPVFNSLINAASAQKHDRSRSDDKEICKTNELATDGHLHCTLLLPTTHTVIIQVA